MGIVTRPVILIWIVSSRSKLLKQEKVADPKHKRRFVQEARAALQPDPSRRD